LPSGEAGPRRIDNSTAMYIRGIPFLNITEFTRAKLRSWMLCVYFPPIHIYIQCGWMSINLSQTHLIFPFNSGHSTQDAVDLIFVLTRFWHRININRIQESDMDRFVQHYPAATQSWESLKLQWSD
jgi:hypothetical protein